MAKYGRASLENLGECHRDLRRIFLRAVVLMDNSILVGHRNKEDQNKAYEEKKSKLRWPESQHNKMPSKAVDAAPYPIDWEDKSRFYYFAGIVKAIAHQEGVEIRWGGDWDGDADFKDQTFNDLVHWELVRNHEQD